MSTDHNVNIETDQETLTLRIALYFFRLPLMLISRDGDC